MKTLIIIPAYNESVNIAKTLGEIAALHASYDCLVIDDGSGDTTAAEARRAGSKVVSLPFNLGIGAAVQTGFKFAGKHKYENAVQVDGDNQHDVRFIATLLEPLKNGQADIVIGSRFIRPFVGYRSSFLRRIGIHFFSYLISALTGCHVTDPTSGFRAYNEKAIALFAGTYPSDFPEPEALVIARRLGLTIMEVPVEMRRRAHGHSSIRYLRTLYYMIKVTLAIILDMLKRKDDLLKA